MKTNTSPKNNTIVLFSHSSEIAGAERTLLFYADVLKKQGYGIFLIIPSTGPLEEEIKKRNYSYSIIPFPFWVKQKGVSEIELLKFRYDSLVQVVKDLEKIHPLMIISNTIVLKIGAMAATILKIPHIWSIHEFGLPEYEDEFEESFEDRCKFIDATSTGVIFSSNVLKKYYQKFIDAEKAAVVYPKISMNYDEKLKEVYFKKKSSLKLISLGTIFGGKRIEDIILAIAKLKSRAPDIEFIVAGKSIPDYKQYLVKLIKSNNLENVKIHDFIESPSSFIESCDVLINASPMESFGLVTVEAMMKKKPVIGCRSGGSNEIIQDGKTGLLYEPKDVNNLAEKILYFYKNREKIKEYGQNAFKDVKTRFNDEIFSKSLLEVVQRANTAKNSNPENERYLREINKELLNLVDLLNFKQELLNFNQDIEKKNFEIMFKRKNNEIRELKRELDVFYGFQKGKIWKSLSLWRFLKKSPKKLVTNIKKYGIKKTTKMILNKFRDFSLEPVFDYEKFNQDYQIWLEDKEFGLKNFNYESGINSFKYIPLISVIIPVYNVEEKYLRACLDSVIAQSYQNWEICIADDASTKTHIKTVLEEYKKKDKRIKVVYRTKNGHISEASNSALKVASGEYVALLDNDDVIYPHAFYKVIEVLNKDKSIDFIYSDEDKLELNGRRSDPFFKPDWSPDLFLSTNYLCHLSVVRKKLVDKVGGFRKGYEGSQDYDLFLRVTEKTNKIHHIPDILYSWRKIPGSTAADYDEKGYANEAALKALSESLERRKLKGTVDNGILPGAFRVKYEILKNPLVSIIIPNRDKPDYLKRCVNSILNKTSYKNYEIVIVDNDSKDPQLFSYYDELKTRNRVRIVHWNNKFNYSAINNFGVENAKGEYILLLNNDTEVINEEWLESMLEFAQLDRVGAVGAKLLYPNKTIQHCGIVLGINGGTPEEGVAGHTLKGMDDFPVGLPIAKDIICNYSAVTAACLLILKKKFLEVDGLDENFRIAFNDVDFCLKLRKSGYYNVYTPYAKLFHHESISVGQPGQVKRDMGEFRTEIGKMLDKWADVLRADPFYNINYSRFDEKLKIKTLT